MVTCLDLDAAGGHLVTGSTDTTCKVWSVQKQNIVDQPLQCLYGHDDCVTCVAISTEYDMVVSGSKVSELAYCWQAGLCLIGYISVHT